MSWSILRAPSRSAIWEKTSHALLVGTILHVLYAEPDKTLAGVANFLSDPKRPIEATLRVIMTTAHLGESGVHPVVASAARELLNKSENERSGVLSTAMSFRGLYRDPVVATVTRLASWFRSKRKRLEAEIVMLRHQPNAASARMGVDKDRGSGHCGTAGIDPGHGKRGER